MTRTLFYVFEVVFSAENNSQKPENGFNGNRTNIHAGDHSVDHS